MSKMSRRRFVQGSLATAAAISFPLVVPSRVLGRDGAVAPGSRITMGVIGYGPRCTSVLGAMLPETDVRFVAMCEVRPDRRAGGKAAIDNRNGDQDCAVYSDFREVLARPDIDGVLIATGDRWHALASVLAARAGKDVYSEKPCAMTIGDGNLLAETMKRYGRAFQAGTQRRSIGNFELAVALAQSGTLGKVHTLHASVYYPRVDYGWLPAEPEPPKNELDWDMWLGPAPWRPYNRAYVNGGWRGHWDFDSGATLLDWGAHTVDLCQWANGSDDTIPIEYEPAADRITARYANGVTLILDFLKQPFGDRSPHYRTHLGTCPVRFEGENGWVETGDNGGIEVQPVGLQFELQKLRATRKMISGLSAASHGRDFFDAMRTRRPTAANPQVVRNSHIACHAAATAWLLGRKLRIDPATATFINDDEANRMRTRAAREPWTM